MHCTALRLRQLYSGRTVQYYVTQRDVTINHLPHTGLHITGQRERETSLDTERQASDDPGPDSGRETRGLGRGDESPSAECRARAL